MTTATANLELQDALNKPVGATATHQDNSDFEEGEFPSEEDSNAINAKHRFVACLPTYFRVNPNLPISAKNQKLTVVRGIDRRPLEAKPENLAEFGLTTAGVGQTNFRLSDFDKIEKIGEGTFGKVYKAEYRDPQTGVVSYYALKKLKMIIDEMTDQGFPLTALREIKYLSTLDHENIVAIRQVIHAKRKY